MKEDSLEPSLQVKFVSEKLRRTINECDDIDMLKQIALELLELNQKKSAIANWASKRAAEAEHKAILSGNESNQELGS